MTVRLKVLKASHNLATAEIVPHRLKQLPRVQNESQTPKCETDYDQ